MFTASFFTLTVVRLIVAVFKVLGSGQKKRTGGRRETRDKRWSQFEPVELSLAYFSVSQLAGPRAATEPAVLSGPHPSDWNRPSTHANLTI